MRWPDAALLGHIFKSNMIVIGCDYHPEFQQIAWLNTDTGELKERRLGHREQAGQFYTT